MPITITDSDGIQEVHIPERLEINLLSEDVNKMKIRIWFNVETRLPNGKSIGQLYWDSQRILELSCENDSDLEAAMAVIQRKIGEAKYKQLTELPKIPEPVENPEMISPIETS